MVHWINVVDFVLFLTMVAGIGIMLFSKFYEGKPTDDQQFQTGQWLTVGGGGYVVLRTALAMFMARRQA